MQIPNVKVAILGKLSVWRGCLNWIVYLHAFMLSYIKHKTMFRQRSAIR